MALYSLQHRRQKYNLNVETSNFIQNAFVFVAPDNRINSRDNYNVDFLIKIISQNVCLPNFRAQLFDPHKVNSVKLLSKFNQDFSRLSNNNKLNSIFSSSWKWTENTDSELFRFNQSYVLKIKCAILMAITYKIIENRSMKYNVTFLSFSHI
jgi:hypothetical protein